MSGAIPLQPMGAYRQAPLGESMRSPAVLVRADESSRCEEKTSPLVSVVAIIVIGILIFIGYKIYQHFDKSKCSGDDSDSDSSSSDDDVKGRYGAARKKRIQLTRGTHPVRMTSTASEPPQPDFTKDMASNQDVAYRVKPPRSRIGDRKMFMDDEDPMDPRRMLPSDDHEAEKTLSDAHKKRWSHANITNARRQSRKHRLADIEMNIWDNTPINGGYEIYAKQVDGLRRQISRIPGNPIKYFDEHNIPLTDQHLMIMTDWARQRGIPVPETGYLGPSELRELIDLNLREESGEGLVLSGEARRLHENRVRMAISASSPVEAVKAMKMIRESIEILKSAGLSYDLSPEQIRALTDWFYSAHPDAKRIARELRDAGQVPLAVARVSDEMAGGR